MSLAKVAVFAVPEDERHFFCFKVLGPPSGRPAAASSCAGLLNWPLFLFQEYYFVYFFVSICFDYDKSADDFAAKFKTIENPLT
jgi:hypothetical protein